MQIDTFVKYSTYFRSAFPIELRWLLSRVAASAFFRCQKCLSKMKRASCWHYRFPFTCNWVSILLDPVICWFNFRKCPINRRSSFRFMLSSNDIGTNRSMPNSRLKRTQLKFKWNEIDWVLMQFSNIIVIKSKFMLITREKIFHFTSGSSKINPRFGCYSSIPMNMNGVNRRAALHIKMFRRLFTISQVRLELSN